MTLSPKINEITDRIKKRSSVTRRKYLNSVESHFREGPRRIKLTEGNLAHSSAGCPLHDKNNILAGKWPNIGVITAYNDMLSAHQPFGKYPDLIKETARSRGAIAQVAGGVPAMCDGITQGQDGMELSLFSRDIIGLSSAIGLSHDTFDAAIHLGVCDKIVPGLLIAALRFGWIPSIFVPAGPMPSGLPNKEKARIRQLFAEGKIGRDKLLKAETESYHSPGTCTFYGTANTNQMLMEIMGLQLPGSSFINPNTPLRDAMTKLAVERAIAISSMGKEFTPIAHIIDEKAIVNGLVGLMATGGSTNLTIHLIAMAYAAGIIINWDDLSEISHIVPLICKIYPNGHSDVNHFHASGGMSYLISELLSHGLLHEDVKTIAGPGGLKRYTQEPTLNQTEVLYQSGPRHSHNTDVITEVDKPFREDGGLALIRGNLGRAICKVSAVHPSNLIVEAPALVFNDQNELVKAFQAGELERDFIAVIRFQGPAANGMPELHKLTPILGALLDKGFKVGLVTDGRMSGASGKVPAVIHLHPEAAHGGALSKLQDGDFIVLDASSGSLNVRLSPSEIHSREGFQQPKVEGAVGTGNGMFRLLRDNVSNAEQGASVIDEAVV